jgi:tRNA A37 threonylcarbamoyltransferase TsaD
MSRAMTSPSEDLVVLGIETSCDETAAAVVSGAGEIRANLVLSQLDEHRPYGGVVTWTTSTAWSSRPWTRPA